MPMFNAGTLLSEEEKAEVHEKLLTDFVTGASGLSGMILIGIREDARTTAIEVTAGALKRDMYRAAASIIESLINGDNVGVRVTDEKEIRIASLLADAILALAGDDPDSVEKVVVDMSEEFNRKN